jgi:hypothetical protein
LPRPDELAHHKVPYAHAVAECKTLEECVDQLKPSALIGVAAVGQAFTNPILKKMAAINKAPVIFALSNPTSKAECTAEEAYTATEGRSVCVMLCYPHTHTHTHPPTHTHTHTGVSSPRGARSTTYNSHNRTALSRPFARARVSTPSTAAPQRATRPEPRAPSPAPVLKSTLYTIFYNKCTI